MNELAVPKLKFKYNAIFFEGLTVAEATEKMDRFLDSSDVSYVNHTTNYIVHTGNIHEATIVLVYKQPIDEGQKEEK